MKFQIKKTILVVLLITSIYFAAACDQNGSIESGNANSYQDMILPEIDPVRLEDGERLAVVATTSIIGDVAAKIGGNAIQLTIIMDAGQDPHSFEPAPKELAAIEQADLILVNGLNLEEVLMESIRNTATGWIVPVSAGIETLEIDGDHHHDEDLNEDMDINSNSYWGDPHFWYDPNNVMVWVRNIEQVLIQGDPDNRETYNANADAYIYELETLDSYIRDQTTLIPEENRKLITDHHVLGYFTDEYGYELVGAVIPSISNTAGASAGDATRLIEVIVQEGVPVIFIGTTASSGMQNLTTALADEIGPEVRIVPIQTGSLAPVGEPGDTYLGYMRYNIDQIVSGLTQ